MLKLLEPQFLYTLEEICKKSGIESPNSVRKYLRDDVPQSLVEKKGNRRPPLYSETTLNALRVLKKLNDRKVLSLTQIKAVLSSLDREQINRIGTGKEELHLHVAVPDEVKELQRKRKSAKETSEKVLLIDGDQVKPIEFDGSSAFPVSKEATDHDWDTIRITENLELRYRGRFSDKQIEELRVAARILKSIAEG